MNALLRGEITDDFWRFGWTVLMGEAKDAGSEVIVITSLDKAMGKKEISEVANRSKARKVFFKTELERDLLLNEVHKVSKRHPLLVEPPSPPRVNCESCRLAHVLAYHTTSKELRTIQQALRQRHPKLTFRIGETVSREIGEQFQHVQKQLLRVLQTLAATSPDAVCTLCEAVLDLRVQTEDLRDNLASLCHCSREFLGSWPSPEDGEYNLRTIRNLLEDAFTAEDLRRFCYDEPHLRSVLKDLRKDSSLNAIIDAVIRYCEQNVLMQQLLEGVKEARNAQFNRHRPHLFGSGTR
jgi:hypothetical protein